jgi:uncharacterized protein (TIGR02996 family)
MTHQDFVDAILAEPSDDAPRLIYADWLEERGDPRAEFIRVQVEMATLARPLNRKSMYGNPMPQARNRRDAARFRELWGRQLELLTTHCTKWVEPLIGKATGVIFERGCVEGISAPPQTFVTHASVWYRSMPINQYCVSAHPSIKDKDWRSLLRSPHLLKIRTLELGWSFTPRHIAALAGCPNVVNVKELFLGFNRLNDELLQQLRKSPNLVNAFLD